MLSQIRTSGIWIVMGLVTACYDMAIAEEYELTPLTTQQETQFEHGQARRKGYMKQGKRVEFSARDVKRLDDDGHLLGTLALPDDAIILCDKWQREFVGYRLGAEVHLVNEAMKAEKSFQTVLRSDDACAVGSDGAVYLLKSGFKKAQSTGEEQELPPAGFVLYDRRGKVLLSEDEASGWEIGTAASSNSAFLVFNRKKEKEAVSVVRFDGAARWTSPVDDKETWPGLVSPPESGVLVCRKGRQAWILRARDLKLLETETDADMPLENVLGDVVLKMRCVDDQTIGWAIRDPIARISTAPTQLKFGREIVSTVRGYQESRLLPNRKDRAMILVRAVSVGPNVFGMLCPTIIDTKTGQIVWKGKQYRPDHAVNYGIYLVAWDGGAMIVPGEARGWAILREANHNTTVPDTATERKGTE